MRISLPQQQAGRSHLAPKAVAISNLLPLLVLGALEGKREEGGSKAVSKVAVERLCWWLVMGTLGGQLGLLLMVPCCGEIICRTSVHKCVPLSSQKSRRGRQAGQ
jgi:hypothetical protein